MNNIYYIYAHYTQDSNELYYIGKGKNNRAYSIHGRNIYWKRIYKKHGLVSRILISELEEKVALNLEKKYIEIFKKMGLCKTNIHVGGCGGDTFTNQPENKKIEIRKKMSNYYKNMSIEDREKLSNIRSKNALGELNSQFGKQGTMSGKKFTNEHKEKISKSLKNNEKNLKHLENIRKSQKIRVKGINLITNEIIIFESISDAQKSIGNTHIGDVCRGDRKSAGGYFWEYIK